jgi:hypothetical protein
MMNTYTVSLTNAERKALGMFVKDIQEWIDNVVHERCRIAVDEVFQTEVAKMIADPSVSNIPADKEAVVLSADITPFSETEE